MILDFALVERARAVLETEQTTETVHEALREVVAQDRRRRLAERELADLTPAAVQRMRLSEGRAS